MALTEKQAQEIKKQLLEQIDNVPEESREEIRKQIESMTNEQIEAFLKKNQQLDAEEEKCLFCSIVKGKTKSLKLDENSEAIAVLDINPISKGHTLIILKEHDQEPTQKSQELAFKIGEKILKKLKPKDITTQATKVSGHTILNVIPIYEDTNFEKRIKIENQELLDIAKELSENTTTNPDTKKEPTQKKEEKQAPTKQEPICLLCSIVQNKSPSYKIDENKDNIAILEINPISKGHTIVIPKLHKEVTDIPANSFTLAKKIAKKIKTKYKPNDVKINPTTINNHAIIEIIPIYDNTDITKKQKLSEEELINLQQELKVKRKEQTKTSSTSKKEDKKIKTNKGSFNLPKRPKYPNLVQFGPRIP